MTLAPGTRLGPYEIVAQIGVGGMGEVYKASDTNLKRAVAIKVLPASVAADAERLARFQREAEVLAALNHPHIAQIYGLEKSDGTIALVMELVEGPTLADRIMQGAIPIDEALAIARQIAEALEAAHEQGIVHRDLKPANIKVRSDGAVKVLDFGLAKAMEPASALRASAGQALSMSPTITSPAMMTGVGMILGTAAYMSPEQARGKTVDRRADIWAFGAVLFEMVTGARAFAGDDVSDVLASVLAREPDWARLSAALPPTLGIFLRRCLHKDSKQRVGDIRDVRLALEGAFDVPQTMGPATSSPSRGRLVWMAAFAVALLAAVAFAVPALRHLRETPPPTSPETRTEIVTPQTADPMSFAISPDGLQIVFAATGDGKPQLWLRPLASEGSQPLAGTEGASYPFWSPDSKSIAFFAGNKLLRLDLGGGTPQLVTAIRRQGRGGTWSVDGTILFSGGLDEPLSRVSASGGAVETVTKLEAGQSSHRFPQFLPDGHRFLYFAQDGRAGVFLGSLDSADTKFLTQASTFARFAAGRLFWDRGGTLVAQPLDVGRAELIGDVTTVANTVASYPISSAAAFSTSNGGTVAYRAGGLARYQLQWFTRAGQQVGAMGDADTDNLALPSLAPDGRRVAVERTVQGNQDVWILDGTRASRFTFDPAPDGNPVWSSDGTRVVFARRNKSGIRDLYVKSAGGATGEELLFQSADDKSPSAWSADDNYVVYNAAQPDQNVWVLPILGTRKPWPFLKGKFEERTGQISPDGQWMTYISNESGRSEIYVRPFTPPPANGGENGSADRDSAQWQISTQGGIYPRWRSDSRELYYIAPDGGMMAVSIKTTGPTLDAGTPVKLFDTRIRQGGIDVSQGRQYDISRDGRFLINSVVDSAAAPITLLINWQPDAKR